MKTKSNLILLLLVILWNYGQAQLHSYDYKRQLDGVSGQWHKIEIPNAIFGNLKDDLSDLRIYGLVEKDTLEAPYILDVSSGGNTRKEVHFKLINTSSNQNGYYFTYEIPKSDIINNIYLDFRDENFDWRIWLEGSQNNKEWFTLLENYRIVSIKNNQTNYKFTELSFPDSEYGYYRLLVQGETRPKLNSATISLNQMVEATYRDYPVANFIVKEGEANTTHIEIDLKQIVPVSYVGLNVLDKVDYYRSVQIQSVADGVETEKGWKYRYLDLHKGILNSIEDNEFKFASTLARKLHIVVGNNDNEPLEFGDVEVKGLIHQLTARFDQKADYYLAYGKANARIPRYDLLNSAANIPEVLPALSLGQQTIIAKKEGTVVSPLFENKLWLWLVMGAVILVLGGFTFKMMRNKSD
jgi:hypothetical protein